MKVSTMYLYFSTRLISVFAALGTELSDQEKEQFVYSGLFMIYMQAVRFLTDHLENDRYYGAAYPGQNMVRTKNQLALLEALLAKEKLYKKWVHETIGGHQIP